MSTPNTKIAVTGANGFIGRHVVERAQELDLNLLAMNRHNGPDLTSGTQDDWANAMVSVDVCIHLAGALPGCGGDGHLDVVNVAGAARVLQGCIEAGVAHFVFVSSIGVNGISTTKHTGPMQAKDEPAPIGDYAVSKHNGEQVLQRLAMAANIGLTIIRPPLVYGASTSGSFASLVKLVEKVPVLPFGGLSNQRDLIGVRNLADCLLCLAEERPIGTFLIRDRDRVSTTELIQLIAQSKGITPRLITLPGPLRQLLMRLPGLRGTVVRLNGDMEVDDTSLAQACSWIPRFTVRDEIIFAAQQRGDQA